MGPDKYSISYRRQVNLGYGEQVTIGLTEEFSKDEVPHDVAFGAVRLKVNLWMRQELGLLQEATT